MKTIVIESQKGGSGKTMLAAHLPVEAERNGEAAWVIDTDRQATLDTAPYCPLVHESCSNSAGC
jgi:chromosome partitioning protein